MSAQPASADQPDTAAPQPAAAPNTTPFIEFRGVSKTYPARRRAGTVHALQGIDLQIAAGEVFGVVGESGSGKSTLLRLVNRLETPTQGSVLVDGTDLATLSAAATRARRRRIGMVFQQFNLLANQTVYANAALPLRLARRGSEANGRRRDAAPQAPGAASREAERARVMELLDFVRMSSHADKHPSQLSGGERQRVAIARALVTEPDVLLCDEPTSALDGHHTEEVMGILSRVRAELGTTILLVSHELDVIKGLCDRAAVLEGGRLTALVDVSPPDAREAFDSYAERAQRFLGPHPRGTSSARPTTGGET
ncbi:methionine ABC transporter ATP-binding protein [Micrococcus terreus]|uniref:methionine ABC transporter ATP-binding protein n=1 Tax=Micrococcus terreus TaxID=574650 RepID=UPI0023F7988E|nr:ATP-binding cassette domain-containing protein [Micrococcus terreus]